MKKPVFIEKGVAAIEFAILLPVLLAVLLGIVNYGLLMYNQAVITNAAREGARYAAIHNSASMNDPDAAVNVARNYAEGNLISFGAPVITVTQTHAQGFVKGAQQEVTVTYTYTGIATLLEFLFVRNGTYESTAVMLHE